MQSLHVQFTDSLNMSTEMSACSIVIEQWIILSTAKNLYLRIQAYDGGKSSMVRT